MMEKRAEEWHTEGSIIVFFIRYHLLRLLIKQLCLLQTAFNSKRCDASCSTRAGLMNTSNLFALF